MRQLIVAAAGLCLVVSACERGAAPDAPIDASPAAPAAASAGTVAPAAFDWGFYAHGGSGDLTFGDGDWAEGASLLSMSCLPGSGRVSVSGEFADQVTLTAGDVTATVGDSGGPLGIAIPTAAPVMAAFRQTRSLSLATPAGPQLMAAKPEGGAAVEAFFVYCG